MRFFNKLWRPGSGHDFVIRVRPKRPRFLARQNGAILVEAAIVLPILVTMFVGMVEFSQAFTARRKVAAVANTIADLVAQKITVNDAGLNDIVSVSNALLAPFSPAHLSLTLTSVGVDASGNTAVLWSCSWSSIAGSSNCTAPVQGCTATGASFTLPEGIPPQPGSSMIAVGATYTYTPAIGQFLLGDLTFRPAAYFKPRLVPCVTKL
jgi:Flp pilus assembly protein TadG